MKKQGLAKRYAVDILGLAVTALGVALMVRSGSGISPISSWPNVWATAFPQITLGQFTMMLNGLMILGQIALLRRDFEPVQLLQIPLSFVFGWCIDGWSALVALIPAGHLLLRYGLLIVGTAVLALGVSLVVLADVVMNSGEALVHAVAKKTGKPFGNCKIAFDVTLVVLSCITSLILLGRIVSVREGTLFAALTCGMMVKAWSKRLGGPLARWFEGK